LRARVLRKSTGVLRLLFCKTPAEPAEFNKVEFGAAKQISGCLRSLTTGFVSPSGTSGALKLTGDGEDSGRRGSESLSEGMTVTYKNGHARHAHLFWAERIECVLRPQVQI